MPGTPVETARDESRLQLRGRPARERIALALRPDPSWQSAIATRLSLDGVEGVTLTGWLEPDGANDWRLEAQLEGRVTQRCVRSAAPVASRIEEPVRRRFLAAPPPEPAGGTETQIPDDDSVEPLTEPLDLGAVLEEALALALPLFPRDPGAPEAPVAAAPPGAAPIEADEARSPFAALEALRRRMDDEGGQ